MFGSLELDKWEGENYFRALQPPSGATQPRGERCALHRFVEKASPARCVDVLLQFLPSNSRHNRCSLAANHWEMSELSAAAQGLSLFNDEPFRPPHRTATNGTTVSFSRASVRRSLTTYSLPEETLRRNQSTTSSRFGRRQSTYNRTTLTSTARPKEPDYLSLLLQTKRLLVDIKFDLLAATSTVELRFIDGLIHAHDLQELSDERLQHLSSLGSRTARDRFAVETYLRTVFQPAYFNLPLKLRETYRDKIDSLQQLLREYDCFSDSYEDDNYDDGLPEFTPEEAEAALNQSDSTLQGHSTVSESKRSSATSFEVGPIEPEAAVSNETSHGEGTTTSDFWSKEEPVPQQRSTFDHALPTHLFRKPLERSSKYFSGGENEDIHSIVSARSAHSTGSIHSSHSKELPEDFYNTLPDPLPLSSEPQEPTWKDIREGKWPPLPLATKGLLLPQEIEDHQTDLPLPPLYTIETSKPNLSMEHRGDRKLTPQLKYKWEGRTSRNKIIPRPDISPPPLRYAKFSWEPESSTDIEDSEMKTIMNSPTGTIRTIDISEDEVLSEVYSDAAVDLRDSQRDTLSIRSDSLSRAASVHVPSYLLGTLGLEQYATAVPGADDPVSASMYGVDTIYKGVQRRFGLQEDPSDDIYYVKADFEAEGEGEIPLSVSQHVKVLAMGFPGENGGAWWLVELLAVASSEEHDTIGSIGWVPNANLTPSVARKLVQIISTVSYL